MPAQIDFCTYLIKARTALTELFLGYLSEEPIDLHFCLLERSRLRPIIC
jgi:hypothetical protein